MKHLCKEFDERPNCKNWVSNVSSILSEIGLCDIFQNHCISDDESKHILFLVKQRLLDIQHQVILAEINSSPKCIIYRHLVDIVTLQSCLCKPLYNSYKKLICKIRLSPHCLVVKTGRYKRISLEDVYVLCVNLT